jgi:hypothetical protein
MKTIGIHIKLYRCLMKLYPNQFRESFGEEMEMVFCDMIRDRNHKGGLTLLLLWVEIVPDVLLSSIEQHWNKSNRRERKLNLSFTSILSADKIGRLMLEMAAVLLIAALITPPDPVSQIRVAIPAYFLCQIVFFFSSRSRKIFLNKKSKGDSDDSHRSL